MNPAPARAGSGMKTQMKSSCSSQAIAAGVDAVDLQFLIGGERGDELALAGVSVKPPAVIAAFHLLAIEVAAGKRHAAVRAGVMQCKGRPRASRPMASGVSSSMAFCRARCRPGRPGRARYQNPVSMRESGVWRWGDSSCMDEGLC